MLFAIMMMAGHLNVIKSLFGSVVFGDYLTAIGFTLLMYVLIHDPNETTPRKYAWLSRNTSNFSYTLYVVHMPFLIFLRAALISDRPWQPTPQSLCNAVLLCLACIAYAFFVAYLTELKTSQVRQYLRKIIA